MDNRLDACDIACEIKDLMAVIGLGFACDEKMVDEAEREGFGLLCLIVEQKARQIIELLSKKTE
jgi:hypothetical protein